MTLIKNNKQYYFLVNTFKCNRKQLNIFLFVFYTPYTYYLIIILYSKTNSLGRYCSTSTWEKIKWFPEKLIIDNQNVSYVIILHTI